MVPDDGTICVAIPSSVFARIKSVHGFAIIHYHVKIRSTSVSIATIKNTTYVYYCYDKLANLSLNYEDTCILLNRGLTVNTEIINGIEVRCKNYSSIF